MSDSLLLSDFKYFMSNVSSNLTVLEASKLLYFEIYLLNYRTRLYYDINLSAIKYLLNYANINFIIQPLYIHKPTIFFHAIYSENPTLIDMMLHYNPVHYVKGCYSLFAAVQLQNYPIIKSLIPYTDIHFEINDTTPYKYVIMNYKKTDPIYRLFEYINSHKKSLKILIKKRKLPTDIIRHIKSFMI